MDVFDQAVATAAPLLRRVDELLSGFGAPPEHGVWAQVRRVRLLPGDAVQAIAGLRAADLAGAAPELRADARAYADIALALPPPEDWTGDAAEAYDNARRRAAGHLSGGAESLDERLEATADLADALVGWIDQSRAEVTAALAEILGSSEAVAVSASSSTSSSSAGSSTAGSSSAGSSSADSSGAGSSDSPVDPGAVRQALAAADIAERLLRTIADSYDLAADLLDHSADLANPLPV
jgi:hypothetical protein